MRGAAQELTIFFDFLKPSNPATTISLRAKGVVPLDCKFHEGKNYVSYT